MTAEQIQSLADSWLERSDRFVDEAHKLDQDPERAQDALRLSTYALLWRLAAHELLVMGDVTDAIAPKLTVAK